ncbi:hypothetical protein LRS10_23000 [Phenylobacterium sp. J426]|nr:hypothetical protein [Phenylobacterium sp. J426]MCR5876772.1 hypothetical protein [Phenylobacterium sp. J426]
MRAADYRRSACAWAVPEAVAEVEAAAENPRPFEAPVEPWLDASAEP